MSAVETGQMTAAETFVLSQQKTSVLVQQQICAVSTEHIFSVGRAEVYPVPTIRIVDASDKGPGSKLSQWPVWGLELGSFVSVFDVNV